LPAASSVSAQLSSSVMTLEPSDPTQLMQMAGVPATPPPGSGQPFGLIVCDPVPSPGLERFSSGCGRWLDLVASGQPELGCTPSWQSRARAQQELGRTDFCLTAEEASALQAMTGVTHVACGTITGTASHAVLTYTVSSLPGLASVGKPIVVSGTEDEIIAALPGVAKTIGTALGIGAPRVPVSVGLTSAEMVEIQNIGTEGYQSDTDLETLFQLSQKCPLAGMYFFNSRATNDRVLHSEIVKRVMAQLPDNPLPVYQGAYQSAQDLWPFAIQTEALIARYPGNALFAHTDIWQQRSWGNRVGEWQAANRYLADAPNDPDAWLAFGTTVGNVGQDLRESRQAQDISNAEWNVLNMLYPQEEKADIRATELDPSYGHAWCRLATSATFQSDNMTAKTALDKAMTLDPDKEEVYRWGLEMDQSKWGVDPGSLNKIAGLAADQAWKKWADAYSAAQELGSAGFSNDSKQVLADFITRQRVEVAKDPTDGMAHQDLAAALAAQNTASTLRGATYQYRIAEHLMPGAPGIHKDLAAVLDARNMTGDAIAEYTQAISLDPFNSECHLQQGFDYKIQSKFPDALRELTLAVRLNPHDGASHWALAELMAKQKLYVQAIPECRAAISMDYFDVRARVELCWLLDGQKQCDAALQAGAQAEHVLSEYTQPDPELDSTLYSSMADAYLQKKEWTKSIDETNKELSENPNSAISHENLAEAYFGEGKLADARAEWQKTIALGDPEITPVAQKFLSENPARGSFL